MSGYRCRPYLDADAFDDGWLQTSDLGVLTADGRLTITGRTDDVIITGGENVAGAAVTAVLAGHPAFAEVAVAGIPDPDWGQRVVAVVVLADGVPAPTLEALRAWCGDRLSAAARPRGLVTVDELPRLSAGKPDRLAIAELALARSGDAGRE
jgi:O-succinylbenzoic acid--CoA ligase